MFKITKDRIPVDGLPSRVGVMGHGWKDGDEVGAVPFKLYDDDGEHYYSGVLARRAWDDGREELVGGPLFDFGAPDAGCTRIDYKNPATGKWEVVIG